MMPIIEHTRGTFAERESATISNIKLQKISILHIQLHDYPINTIPEKTLNRRRLKQRKKNLRSSLANDRSKICCTTLDIHKKCNQKIASHICLNWEFKPIHRNNILQN
jgi:hypothetical protein